jgi:uncharacterized membrane protein YjjP (DUF1212 family)
MSMVLADGIDEENFDIAEGDSQEDDVTKKKKFVLRLVKALQSSGNFSFRTESVTQTVAHSLGLNCVCTIFPVLATLTFYHDSSYLHPTSTESYSIRIKGGFSCSKLGALDNLCFDLTRSGISFKDAEVKLAEIDEATPV